MSKTSSILNVFQICRGIRVFLGPNLKKIRILLLWNIVQIPSLSAGRMEGEFAPLTPLWRLREGNHHLDTTVQLLIMIVDEKILTFCQQENKVLSKTVDGWGVQVIKVIKSNFISYLVQRNLDFRPLFCVLNLWTGKASLPLYHILQTSSGLSLDCSESVTDFEFQSIFRALQICRTYVSLLF